MIVTATTTVATLGGCDRPPSSSSAREWTAADHDRAEEGQTKPGGAVAPAAKQPPTKEQEARNLADLTWRTQCASCHGAEGRGDGPSGPMVQAPSIADAAFQARATDADIAAVIKNGRGRMPKFDLPDPLVAALVTRVRSLRAK